MSHYIKEEIIHCHNIPALIKYQRLEGINCSVPLHWHKDIELNLMLNGIGEFTVNGEKTVIRSGDLILINSEDVHMGEPPLSIPLKERKLELITLLWDYDFLFQYADHISEHRFQLDNFGVNDKKNISDMIRHLLPAFHFPTFYESQKSTIRYAIGSGGGNIITCIVGYYMAAYYTDSVGIAAATVGTILLLVRIFDGITDVIMGSIIDKTTTKWGKSRPWLFVSGFLCAIGLALAFAVPQTLKGTGQLVYVVLTYVFLNCVAYTALMVSHTSMMSRITLDNHERSVMSSMNQIANQFGFILVTVLTVRLSTAFGWNMAALFFGVVAGVTIIISAIGTREHLGEDAGTGEVHVEKVDLKKAVPAMLKNKYFWLLALVFVLVLIMIGYILKGLGCGPIFTCGFALAAAVVDYGEWKFGIRSEGLINSCVSFGQKVGNGLGSAASSWILAIGGYVGTVAVQSDSAIAAIRFAFSYFGAILGVVMLIVCFLFDIDKHMDQVHASLEAKMK